MKLNAPEWAKEEVTALQTQCHDVECPLSHLPTDAIGDFDTRTGFNCRFPAKPARTDFVNYL
ncbi:MAG TPA: hypothetical protein VGM98_17355 [Schlesneria sp.]|jgi:hypothetical protein